MKKCAILLLLFILWISTSCDSPTGFEKSNKHDPTAPGYRAGTITGLQAIADTSGLITIQWTEPDELATKLILEKSLGDSLNYQPIAEIRPDTLQYSDVSSEVRKKTYYRLSSWLEVPESDDLLIESSQTDLEFGSILNLQYEFLDEDNSFRLHWQTDVPFFTHFILTSENFLNEQGEYSVKIDAEGTNHFFIDPLFDIDFETRNYTVKGIIEVNETEEVIALSEISLDIATIFHPLDVEIIILNEQDWKVSWQGAPFFATNVEVIRIKSGKENVTYLIPPEATSVVDSVFIRQEFQSNEERQYKVRFLTENGASQQISVFDNLSIQEPVVNKTGNLQDNPDSFTLSWNVFDPNEDLIKEFIIEKAQPFSNNTFSEYARVNGNVFEFVDANVNPNQLNIYRVRTVTSYPSHEAAVTYSNNYTVEYSIDTGLNALSRMEVSKDRRYMAIMSIAGNSEMNHTIFIKDLISRQFVAEIKIPDEQITDFKISTDDQYIYFAVHTEGAIYRADFPSGNNVVKIIENVNGIYSIDVSSDNSFIIGSNGSTYVKRWNLETFDLDFETYNSSGTLYNLKNITISPDNTIIGAGHPGAVILDAASGAILQTLSSTNDYLIDLQFSADGKYYSYLNIDVNSQRLYIYSTEDWSNIHTFSYVSRADFHPDNSTLVIAGFHRVFSFDIEAMEVLDIISDENNDGYSTFPANRIFLLNDDTVVLYRHIGHIDFWEKTNTQGWKFLY